MDNLETDNFKIKTLIREKFISDVKFGRSSPEACVYIPL